MPTETYNPSLIRVLPKGGRRDRIDSRDLRVRTHIFGAVPAMDFSKGSGLAAPPDSDQYSSLSCGAHAWTKYHWRLKNIWYSVRDLYSYTRFPEGGQEARSGGVRIVNVGQLDQVECPDPTPQTEAAMSIKSPLSDSDRADSRELSSYRLPEGDINAIAWAVQNFLGVVWGVIGDNAGWRNLAVPEPPSTLEGEWGHLIYAYDYHMHDGERCIINASSWCNSGVRVHHIRERYFKLGQRYTFNPWTLIPKEQNAMYKTYFVHLTGTQLYGFLEVSRIGTHFTPIDDPGDLVRVAREAGVNIFAPDGTTIDYSKAREINLPAAG